MTRLSIVKINHYYDSTEAYHDSEYYSVLNVSKNSVEIGQLLQCMCNYATNSLQCTRNDIYIKFQVKSRLECSQKLNYKSLNVCMK